MRRRSCESDTPSCIGMYIVVCNDGSSALMVAGLLQIPLACHFPGTYLPTVFSCPSMLFDLAGTPCPTIGCWPSPELFFVVSVSVLQCSCLPRHPVVLFWLSCKIVNIPPSFSVPSSLPFLAARRMMSTVMMMT